MLSLDLSFYNWELFTTYILKGFDQVYMPGMEDFLDSICENGLSESRYDRSGLKRKAEGI